MRSYLGVAAFLVCTGAWPAVSFAHPLIDQAVAAYEAADFEVALDFLIEAEGRSDLRTDDLLHLLELRALVYYASEDETQMRDDLRRLASVQPTRRLSPVSPPPVRSAFDKVREEIESGIAIDLTAEVFPGRLRIAAVVRKNVTGIGRLLEIHTKIDGENWRRVIGERAIVRVGRSTRVQYFASLIGPGGAVVAQAGSAERPRIAEVPEPIGGAETEKRKVPLGPVLLWSSAGAVLLGAAIAGPIALNKEEDLRGGCGATTPPTCTQTELDKVTRYGRATDALWISGVVMATAGTVWYLVKRKQNKEKRSEEKKGARARTLELAPWAGRRGLGATARLAF